MDKKTMLAYDRGASDYSQDWLSQPPPEDMYRLLERFFVAGGKTADIGCGNGRDAHWLAKHGFLVQGFDCSAEMLSLASGLFPQIPFKTAFLPDLKDIHERFQNVICETVIMHLEKSQIPEAIRNLKRLLEKEGVLYLSWRVTESKDVRQPDGRLYSAFDPDFILDEFAQENILFFSDNVSASSGKRVCRLIYKNSN